MIAWHGGRPRQCHPGSIRVAPRSGGSRGWPGRRREGVTADEESTGYRIDWPRAACPGDWCAGGGSGGGHGRCRPGAAGFRAGDRHRRQHCRNGGRSGGRNRHPCARAAPPLAVSCFRATRSSLARKKARLSPTRVAATATYRPRSKFGQPVAIRSRGFSAVDRLQCDRENPRALPSGCTYTCSANGSAEHWNLFAVRRAEGKVERS